MAMTPDQRAVLAHVVIDPDAWYAHAVAHFGQEIADRHLAAKVARWQPSYDAEVVKPGYRTRAVRETAERQRQAAELEAAREA